MVHRLADGSQVVDGLKLSPFVQGRDVNVVALNTLDSGLIKLLVQKGVVAPRHGVFGAKTQSELPIRRRASTG